MNMHKNARLTPRGRERIVRQVASGQTPEAVAEAAGICPRTRPVHLALSSLSPHSGCHEHRQARDCRALASQGFEPVLAMEIPLAGRPAADRPRGARHDPKNEF
jgi:hypothetical protein